MGTVLRPMIVTCWWRAYLRPGFLDPVDRMSSVVAGTEGMTRLRSCFYNDSCIGPIRQDYLPSVKFLSLMLERRRQE